MQLLGGDEEEVKEGKWLKILTRNKLCTKLVQICQLLEIKCGWNVHSTLLSGATKQTLQPPEDVQGQMQWKLTLLGQ